MVRQMCYYDMSSQIQIQRILTELTMRSFPVFEITIKHAKTHRYHV